MPDLRLRIYAMNKDFMQEFAPVSRHSDLAAWGKTALRMNREESTMQ